VTCLLYPTQAEGKAHNYTNLAGFDRNPSKKAPPKIVEHTEVPLNVRYTHEYMCLRVYMNNHMCISRLWNYL